MTLPSGQTWTYKQTENRWFDFWLWNVRNGIMDEPTRGAPARGPGLHHVRQLARPGAREVGLRFAATDATAPGALTTGKPPKAKVEQRFVDEGRTIHPDTLVSNPDTASANRLAYRSPELTQSVRISGRPEMRLRMAIDNKPDANLTAYLVDYGPAGSTAAPTVVTRGWMDPQNRKSAARTQPVKQGKLYDYRWTMEPKDYVFPAGHRIGMVVFSSDQEYTLLPLGGTELRVAPERQRTAAAGGRRAERPRVLISPSCDRWGSPTRLGCPTRVSGGVRTCHPAKIRATSGKPACRGLRQAFPGKCADLGLSAPGVAGCGVRFGGSGRGWVSGLGVGARGRGHPDGGIVGRAGSLYLACHRDFRVVGRGARNSEHPLRPPRLHPPQRPSRPPRSPAFPTASPAVAVTPLCRAVRHPRCRGARHHAYRSDLRKTALTAAGLAFTGGAIAGPVTAAYAAEAAKPAARTQADRKPAGERQLKRALRGPAELLLLRPRRHP